MQKRMQKRVDQVQTVENHQCLATSNHVEMTRTNQPSMYGSKSNIVTPLNVQTCIWVQSITQLYAV